MRIGERTRHRRMLGLDSSGSDASSASVLRARSGTLTYEPLQADLLAAFAAQSGSGLYPPLSVLALEIVLNEIVAQACATTGATGAAIFLRRAGEMVCRASSGPATPENGERLDTSFKLCAECLKTQQTQRCDDLLADPQADIEAWRQRDVRSVILMPLLQGEELVGLFELLSSRPSAFGEREERTLQELGCRTMNKLQQVTESLEGQRDAGSIPEPQPERPKEVDPRILRYIRSITWVLALVVLVCLLLFGVLVARHFGVQKTTVRTNPPAPASVAIQQAPLAVVSSSKQEHLDSSGGLAPQAKPRASNPVPPGGLVVVENGKEVFRLPPVKSRDKAPTPELKAEPHGDTNQ